MKLWVHNRITFESMFRICYISRPKLVCLSWNARISLILGFRFLLFLLNTCKPFFHLLLVLLNFLNLSYKYLIKVQLSFIKVSFKEFDLIFQLNYLLTQLLNLFWLVLLFHTHLTYTWVEGSVMIEISTLITLILGIALFQQWLFLNMIHHHFN